MVREVNFGLVGIGFIFQLNRFKLLLRRPEGISSDDNDVLRSRVSALPPQKTIIDVFGDFMQYLFACTRTYITKTHAMLQRL